MILFFILRTYYIILLHYIGPHGWTSLVVHLHCMYTFEVTYTMVPMSQNKQRLIFHELDQYFAIPVRIQDQCASACVCIYVFKY